MLITNDQIRQIAPSARESVITPFAIFFSKYAEKYEINSYLRVCHFLAQAAEESDGFKTLEEYASGAAYEGRKDLGNVCSKSSDTGLFHPALLEFTDHLSNSRATEIRQASNVRLAGPQILRLWIKPQDQLKHSLY